MCFQIALKVVKSVWGLNRLWQTVMNFRADNKKDLQTSFWFVKQCIQKH